MASVTASYPQILALAAAVVAIGGGAVWLYSRAANIYRRTLGSRRDLANRLSQVAAGVTTRYLEERFGAPAFVRTSDIPVQRSDMELTGTSATEQVYRTRHAWLQVLIDENDAVIRFSITVSDPYFFFRTRDLTAYNMDVQLGRSNFKFLPPQDGRSLWIGARRHEYSESFYFGNPGKYQRYVLSSNDAGVGGFGRLALPKDISTSFQEGTLKAADADKAPPPPGISAFDPDADYASRFRDQTTINTLTVLGAGYGPATLARPRGPDADYVRVLVAYPWELRKARRRDNRSNRRFMRAYERGMARGLSMDEAVRYAVDETDPPST